MGRRRRKGKGKGPLPRSVRIPAAECPHCSRRLDGATGLTRESRRPGPGSLCICVNCGKCSVFTESLSLRAMTPAEAFRAHMTDLGDYLDRIRESR